MLALHIVIMTHTCLPYEESAGISPMSFECLESVRVCVGVRVCVCASWQRREYFHVGVVWERSAH